jgi:hypothetical protein
MQFINTLFEILLTSRDIALLLIYIKKVTVTSSYHESVIEGERNNKENWKERKKRRTKKSKEARKKKSGICSTICNSQD